MPVSVDAELRANFDKFQAAVKTDGEGVAQAVLAQDEIFFRSYKLICAFRGWHEVALTSLSEEVVGFFIEAHNDLLTSHVHAASGMWRSALISLRSFMESYLAFVYFKDHPVELALWKTGEYRLEPKVLRQYCASHPELRRFPAVKAAVGRLNTEYSKLSGSVHGSKVDFRMTSPSVYPAIATNDIVKLRAWQKLQNQAVRTALLIFMGLYVERLRGAAFPLFRKVLGVVLTPTVRLSIKNQLAVNL